MSQGRFFEGSAPFKIPGRDNPCETYYKIYGDLNNGSPPLLVLHGGPGAGHDYLEPYRRIWTDYQIPVVFYDQIGCAASTHLRDTIGDKAFWQVDLFVAELANLIEYLQLDKDGRPGFHILAHSFGGYCAVAYAARQPPGLRRLVLAGANADCQMFKKNMWELKKQLSTGSQQAIDDAVQNGGFDQPAYKQAMGEFMRTFLCRARPFPPPELARSYQAEDPTVPHTMHGLSPFLYNGSMEDYTSIPLLPKITVPTLAINGEFDTAQDSAVEPFARHSPNVRWVKLPGASHMAHLDSEEMLEKILRLVGGFLQDGNVPSEFEAEEKKAMK